MTKYESYLIEDNTTELLITILVHLEAGSRKNTMACLQNLLFPRFAEENALRRHDAPSGKINYKSCKLMKRRVFENRKSYLKICG